MRAEGGHVLGFGTGGEVGLTTFLVVLPEESSMNGAPPIEALLPPCEGIPQVQPGV